MSRIAARLLAATASAALASGALAASAVADPTPTTPTSPTTPTTPAPPSTTPTQPTTPTTPPAKPTGPARAKVGLTLPDAFSLHRTAVSVPRRTVHITGTVRPYVAGQVVTVRAYLGHRLIRRSRLRIKPSQHGKTGTFTIGVSSPHPGVVSIAVTHQRTSEMLGFTAVRRYAALAESIGFGSTGRFVQLIQQRLAALHLYLPQSGVFDQQTALALDAYHRLLRWGTSPQLDGRTISYLLDGFGAFKVRFPGQGRHAEGDLSHQLLALIDGPQVQYILPISSGKSSTPTVVGNFQVYSRVPGYLPDGMYYSSFFTGGYAIHGYDPAPDYPASHGCMRLPISDAIFVYNWLNFGDGVDTYYR
jgi:L,D-transpeptidase catalytic domain